MMLDVTQKHIDRGCRQICSLCPVALAFDDAGFKDVHVRTDYSRLDGRRIIHSLALDTFIRRFDGLLPVKPHRFRIPGLVKP